MTTLSRPDLPELRLARRQHGVVSIAQLHAAGLTANAIRHRAGAGRLHRVHQGVYAVGRPDLTREGRWLAAVLACGPAAALSHVAAGVLWEVVEHGDERPWVTVPTRAGRRGPRGVRVSRSGTLDAAQVTVRRAIPVTTLPRTLLDLALVLDRRRLLAAVRQAERVHRLDLVALYAAVDGPGGDPRRGRLRAALARYVPGDTRPGLETVFLELCRRHRLPIPDSQVRVGRHRPDFLWPAERLVVETDDAGSHVTLAGRRADHEKDRALMAAGYVVLRFTWPEIDRQPAMVAREIRAHLRRRRRELGARVD